MASDLALAATVAPFQADSDPATTAQRWKKWTDRFENLMIALQLTDPTRKKALLLHLAGESVQDTFDGLIVDDVPEDADLNETNVYTQARKALDDFFAPSKNVTFEVYNFRLARQTAGESTDSYHARLRTLAKYCQFEDIDNEIKAQIIQTCVSSRLRRYALTEPTISLKQLLDKARSMEAAEKQVKAMENGTQPNISAIRRGRGRQIQSSGRRTYNLHNNVGATVSHATTCRNCGGTYPHQGGRTACPAYDKECRGCGKKHHFQRMCFSGGSTRQKPPQQNDRRTQPPSQSRPTVRKQGVHQLQEADHTAKNEAADSDDWEYMYAINNRADRKKVTNSICHYKSGRSTNMSHRYGSFGKLYLRSIDATIQRKTGVGEATVGHLRIR